MTAPGEIPSNEDLVKAAEQKIRKDRRLTKIVKDKKKNITSILQGCINNINDQLEKGERMCSTAHFPLLHEFEMKDLEALANRDFTIDLRADVVDEALTGLTDDLLEIFWSVVPVENKARSQALQRHNEALLGRMETLEYHLADRSHQLSNCRYAYFLELTHLRNQVYKMQEEGEKFDPDEVYFFDPTDFLEEELRTMLNDKIKMSVKAYDTKLKNLQRHCEDLEAKLSKIDFDPSKMDSPLEVLRNVVRGFGATKVVDAMGDIAAAEMETWAKAWAKKQGLQKPDAHAPAAAAAPAAQQKSSADSERDWQAENKALELELKQLRDALAAKNMELNEAQKQLALVKDQLQYLEANKQQSQQKQAPPDNSAEIELLKKQLREMQARLDRQAASAQPSDSGGDHDDLKKKLAEMKAQIALLKSELTKEQEARRIAEEKAKAAEAANAEMAAQRQQRVSENITDDAAATEAKALRDALAKVKNEMAKLREENDQAEEDSDNADTVTGEPSMRLSRKSIRKSLASELDDEEEDEEADDDQRGSTSRGTVRSRATLSLRSSRFSIDQGLIDEVGKSQELGDEQRRQTQGLLVDINWMAEELDSRQQAIEQLNKRLTILKRKSIKKVGSDGDEGEGTAEAGQPQGGIGAKLQARNKQADMGERVQGLGGPECSSQTNIVGTHGGFYLLEYPPTEAELAVETELEDLNSCAMANWEITLERIKSSRRPPQGYGTGFCPPGPFKRLFHGAQQRIQRQNDLRDMIEELTRSEFDKIVEAVHLLQESTMPNEVVELRDLIFGKGLNKQNLAAKTGRDFDVLAGEWLLHLDGFIRLLDARREDVELGVHNDRRTFMPGGAGGGAGVGAFAGFRRTELSPSRAVPFAGVEEEDDEELHEQFNPISMEGTSMFDRPRLRVVSASPAQGMAGTKGSLVSGQLQPPGRLMREPAGQAAGRREPLLSVQNLQIWGQSPSESGVLSPEAESEEAPLSQKDQSDTSRPKIRHGSPERPGTAPQPETIFEPPTYPNRGAMRDLSTQWPRATAGLVPGWAPDRRGGTAPHIGRQTGGLGETEPPNFTIRPQTSHGERKAKSRSPPPASSQDQGSQRPQKEEDAFPLPTRGRSLSQRMPPEASASDSEEVTLGHEHHQDSNSSGCSSDNDQQDREKVEPQHSKRSRSPSPQGYSQLSPPSTAPEPAGEPPIAGDSYLAASPPITVVPAQMSEKAKKTTFSVTAHKRDRPLAGGNTTRALYASTTLSGVDSTLGAIQDAPELSTESIVGATGPSVAGAGAVAASRLGNASSSLLTPVGLTFPQGKEQQSTWATKRKPPTVQRPAVITRAPEPDPELGPGLSRVESSPAGLGFREPPRTLVDRSRDLEWVRRNLTEGTPGNLVGVPLPGLANSKAPTPSWEYEQKMAQRIPRSAGGGHTRHVPRPAPQGAVTAVRANSAGALRRRRPSLGSIQGSSASAQPPTPA